MAKIPQVSRQFLDDDSGAITVDWVVLSAAVVGMAIAVSGVMRGGISNLTSDLDMQLRTQQISDGFVQFVSAHFEGLYAKGILTEVQANEAFVIANDLTNAEIMAALQHGMGRLANGEALTDAECASLIAMASIAYQRNIIDYSVVEAILGITAVG